MFEGAFFPQRQVQIEAQISPAVRLRRSSPSPRWLEALRPCSPPPWSRYRAVHRCTLFVSPAPCFKARLFGVGLIRAGFSQLEEEESGDSFDVDVAVTNPEKVGQSVCFYLEITATH